MPEEFYGYKANPAEMSFAGLMVHIANSNQFRFAQISEDKTPAPAAPKQWTKATIIDRLRESFDYCIGKLGRLRRSNSRNHSRWIGISVQQRAEPRFCWACTSIPPTTAHKRKCTCAPTISSHRITGRKSLDAARASA